MKINKLFIAVLLTGITSSQAQVYMSDAYNNSSQAYDFSNAETVATATSGVGYVSSNSGQHYHFGPAAATLTVNGVFNAYNFGSFGTPATPGVDFFQGLNGNKATAQEIAGNTAPRFGILKLDNGANTISLTNTAGAEVGLRTDFTNAITTTIRSNTNAGALRFLNGATYTGSVAGSVANASTADNQHVNGYVGKIGNNAFVFPVGSGTDARPLSISAPGTATDEYEVAWIVGDPATNGDPSNSNAMHSRSMLGANIVSVSPAGQWDWVPVSGTGAGLTITVSIPDLVAYSYTPALRLVGWNGTQWVNLSTGTMPYMNGGVASYASENSQDELLQGTMIAGIQAIGIGTIGTLLPVQLLSFTAEKQGNTAASLNWKTSTEQNTRYFEVEKSADGRSFTAAGRVAAAGNSTTVQAYSLPDATPFKGANYYRLKIVNTDGSFTYSELRLLNFSTQYTILLYPNPVKDHVTITGTEAGMNIEIWNTAGQRLLVQKATGTTVFVAASQLPAGLYEIQVRNQAGELISTQKLIKQ